MATDTHPPESSPNGHGSAGAPSDAGPTSPTPPDAWQPLWQSFDELREYVTYYLAVQADRLRLQLRKLIVAAIAGVVAGVAGITLIATAAVLVLSGLGEGLGHVLGDRIWLGNLIVGAIVLIATGTALAIIGYGIVRKSRERTIGKYDSRRATQRRRFGHDISGR